MPWYLGGNGKVENSFANIPFAVIDKAVFNYNLVSFGFRLESLINHLLFNRGAGDFEEMLLHDLVTCFLFFGMLFGNFLPVGSMIAILHDICDFPCHFSKGLHASTME